MTDLLTGKYGNKSNLLFKTVYISVSFSKFRTF